jgi:hypothetical protein
MATTSGTKSKRKRSAKAQAYQRHRKDLAHFRKITKYLRDEAEQLPPGQRRKQLAHLMREDAVPKPTPYMVMLGDQVIHRTFDFSKACDVQRRNSGASIATTLVSARQR